MSSRPIEIAMLWHTIGHGNLGVDALARSNIAIVRAAAERVGRTVRFTTLGYGHPDHVTDLPADVQVGQGPKIKQMLLRRSDFVSTLKRTDIVIDIGEGDSWTDIYGTRRFTLQAVSKLAALAFGKPLVLAPQTIGPFNHPITRQLSNWIMSKAEVICTRDSLSSLYLADQGVRAEVAEYIDVAFRLPFAARPRGGGNRPKVGINVSGLLYQGGYSGKNELGLSIDYKVFTHQLINALFERDAEIYLIPHVIVPGAGKDDDLAVIPALRDRFPYLPEPEVFVDASAAKSFMSGLDFVVGGRMHACIGAFSAGTPVVPVAYSRKFNGLFGTLSYPHYVDGKLATTADALEQTLAGFDNRRSLAHGLRPGLALAESRLDAYETKLSELLIHV